MEETDATTPMIEKANEIVSINCVWVLLSIPSTEHSCAEVAHGELALELGLVAEFGEELVVRMAELGEAGVVVVSSVRVDRDGHGGRGGPLLALCILGRHGGRDVGRKYRRRAVSAEGEEAKGDQRKFVQRWATYLTGTKWGC